MPSPLSAVAIERRRGAVARVDPEATAFADRDAPYNVVITGEWVDPSESGKNVQWARDCWEALRPYAKPSVYISYLDDAGARLDRPSTIRVVVLEGVAPAASTGATKRREAR